MKKNEKKTENAIVKALNSICDMLKNESEGFVWLTHFVDHANFPQSLKLVFVYDTRHSLVTAQNEATFQKIFELTEAKLSSEGIYIKRIEKAVFFDTEENGADFDNTKWCRKYT